MVNIEIVFQCELQAVVTKRISNSDYQTFQIIFILNTRNNLF